MSHRPTTDDDLGRRLRAGIDAGTVPAPDLADVQRRADRRARRTAVGTAVVAGASALALAVVLAVAVPAIHGVVLRRTSSEPVADAPAPRGDAPEAPADDARLADFTDPQRWPTLPPLRTVGRESAVALSTPEDLGAAFPGPWPWGESNTVRDSEGPAPSWCRSDALPGRDSGGAAVRDPTDEIASTWYDGSAQRLGRSVQVDVLRWCAGSAVEGAGVDPGDLDAADAWGAGIADDAATCPDATLLDPSGLPGGRATLTAVDDDGRWRVQAVMVGGPTAVRVQATIEADDAQAAGDQAVALARRVIANVVRADDVEQGRADPGPLP